MEITGRLFESIVYCPYKAHLLLQAESGKKSDYEILQDELKIDYLNRILANLQDNKRFTGAITIPVSTLDDLREGHEFILNTCIANADLSAHFDAIERTTGNSALGPFFYSPMLLSHRDKIFKEDKTLLAFRGLLLTILQNREPEYGRIIYGASCNMVRINLGNHLVDVKHLIAKLKLSVNDPPPLVLNQHCQVCEFKETCQERAIKEDNLSLLGPIGPKEIAKLSKKGIFTLTQLSCTFRPRRKRKRPDGYRRPHSIALRALAIREKKIYVHEIPILPNTDTEIYFDVEGSDGGNFIYLVGLVVVKKDCSERYSFWANTPADETDIFLESLKIINSQGHYTLYHYGHYELAYLKRMKKKVHGEARKIDNAIAQSYNILSILYSNIYLPTYTNGLKDVGTFLGFHWTDKSASGIQSLIWRQRWETSGLPDFKEKLIQYNIEDCLALLKVKELINWIKNNESDKQENHPNGLVFLKELKRASPFKFLVGEFALPEFETLNKCAHFDYQRERVHVRTSNYLKKFYSKATVSKNRPTYKVNTSLIPASKEPCPTCNSISRKQLEALSKRVIDLKFFKGGGQTMGYRVQFSSLPLS